MKKIGLPLLSLLILLSCSCKNSKKDKRDDETQIFPVLSFIKSQVAHVDTSLYTIRKVVYVDSTRSDTSFFNRDQFRELASEFLHLPDLADPKYKGRFTEKRSFDETLNRALFIVEPLNADKEEIQRQEVLIRPDPPNDQVTSIIIDYFVNNRDSSVQKRMLWQVDRSFQVSTTRQLPGKPETTSTYKVIWNDEDE